jgi:DNA-binding Lrp family transcriptional regulator
MRRIRRTDVLTERVLRAVQDDPTATYALLAEKVFISLSTVKHCLDTLEATGRIVVKRTGRRQQRARKSAIIVVTRKEH